MTKRLQNLFAKKKDILTLFVTVGYPNEELCFELCDELIQQSADCIELGFPFSDSLVDGPVIQACNEVALALGMNFDRYFSFVEKLRKKHPSFPLVFMGSLNPVLRIGVDSFLQRSAKAGLDGFLLPDLPPEEFQEEVQMKAEELGLAPIMLVTQRTSPERIRMLDALSKGFLYVVSSESTTGNELQFQEENQRFFEMLKAMQLENPLLIGFGIRNASQRNEARKYFGGVIIGSALLRSLEGRNDIRKAAAEFMEFLRI